MLATTNPPSSKSNTNLNGNENGLGGNIDTANSFTTFNGANGGVKGGLYEQARNILIEESPT